MVAFCCFLSGCRQEEPAVSHLLVEGWIEEGKHPIVMLHRSCPYDQIDTTYEGIEDLVEDYHVPFGKVTISDGDTTVVLTGRVNLKYLPPYTYSSVYIRGEAGKTYYLTVQYGDYYATAQTTLPARASFDSICVRQQGTDRMSVVGYIRQAPARTHYLVFAKPLRQAQYNLCPLGVVTTPDSVSDVAVNVYNPFRDKSNNPIEEAFSFFERSDTTGIYIKIAMVDDEAFAFWDSFSTLSLFGGVLFIPVRQNITSNIHGGIGYWCGMGSTEYYLPLDKPRTYYND